MRFLAQDKSQKLSQAIRNSVLYQRRGSRPAAAQNSTGRLQGGHVNIQKHLVMRKKEIADEVKLHLKSNTPIELNACLSPAHHQTVLQHPQTFELPLRLHQTVRRLKVPHM